MTVTLSLGQLLTGIVALLIVWCVAAALLGYWFGRMEAETPKILRRVIR